MTATTSETESSLEQTFRDFASIFNGITRETFTRSEEEVIERLFDPVVSIGGDEIGLSQWKLLFQGFLHAGRKLEILQLEFLGDHHHVEFKLQITGPKNHDLGYLFLDHAIAWIDPTSSDQKIVGIQPLHQDAADRILFELKFRDYFSLYDGTTQKGFGPSAQDIFLNLFDKDFRVTIQDETYNQQEWMEVVKTCIMNGTKIDICKFYFLPNTTKSFVYKLRVKGNRYNKEDVCLLAVGRVKDGKFTSFIPSNDKAYQSVFPRLTSNVKEEKMKKTKKKVGKKRNNQKPRLEAPKSPVSVVFVPPSKEPGYDGTTWIANYNREYW